MEGLKRALSPLQWSLSLSGCILFPSWSILVNILVAVHGICLVLIYGLYPVSLAQKLNVAVTVMDVVDYIWNCEFVIFSIISIVLYWYRRKKLMQLFQALSCLLTQNDLRNLRRISLSLLIFRIVVTITTRYLVWGLTNYSSSKFRISLTDMFSEVHLTFITGIWWVWPSSWSPSQQSIFQNETQWYQWLKVLHVQGLFIEKSVNGSQSKMKQ